MLLWARFLRRVSRAGRSLQPSQVSGVEPSFARFHGQDLVAREITAR